MNPHARTLRAATLGGALCLALMCPAAQAAQGEIDHYPTQARLHIGQTVIHFDIGSSGDSAARRTPWLNGSPRTGSESRIAEIRVNGSVVGGSPSSSIVTVTTESGEVVSSSSTTVSLEKQRATEAAQDAKKATGTAPRIAFSLSKDILKDNSVSGRTFRAFYNQGGTHYHNDTTSKQRGNVQNKDTLNGIYFASIVSLCQKDYLTRTKGKPQYVGLPAALDGLDDTGMATVRTWLRSVYPKASVGTLSNFIRNYPGIEDDIPLDTMGAIDCVIEGVYAVDSKHYVVSALAYYGELRRFGYDIGLEQTKSGWTVHFFKLVWAS